jgi:predicted metal-binding membrane protein
MSHMSMSAPTSGSALLAFLWPSSLMTMAMMAPLLIAPLRYLGDRSLPQRRTRSRLLFLAPCCTVWILGGLALQEIAALLSRRDAFLASGIALIATVVWQWSPAKQLCLNGHHKRPSLAAFGYRADEGALKFGLGHGVWAFGSCWTLMLIAMTVGAHLAVMAPVSLLIWAEQFDQPAETSWRIHLPRTGMRVSAHSLSKMWVRPTSLWLASKSVEVSPST